MTTVVWGSTRKPVASQQLAATIEANFPQEGVLYIGYPVLSAAEGVNSIDALWISPERGLVIFQIIEGRDIAGYDSAQDEYANNLETRLRPHKILMNGRHLLAAPTTVTYAPLANLAHATPDYRLANDTNLLETLQQITWDRPDLYEAAHSIIQSISSIRKGRKRRIANRADSRGAVLKALEDSIANLDSRQSRAVIETVEGVQRIRGLAGSGKTIILALKAAYLHAQHPDWDIAVTFNTRSLKDQFAKLIETFVVDQTGEIPDWTKLQILNAWGAPGGASRSGVYYQFCQANGVEFHDFQAARNKFARGDEFGGICQLALNSAPSPIGQYDLVLVDEAHDFDANFLRLCYAALRAPKRLVYAYDELQSLTDATLPPPEELFGADPDGRPVVTFRAPQQGQPNQDIILEKCYRNSRPVLATAHALGFGIYRDVDPVSGTGLIQMFERSELWGDVGYVVTDGILRDGERVVLERTPQSSPEFLEAPAAVDPLIEFHVFSSLAEQAEWLAAQIAINVTTDELGHSDIIVINPDPVTTVKQVGAPRRILFSKGIQTHVAGVDTSADVFFRTDEESVAFTGVFRAKGNEAGMVYIMNAHDCLGSHGNVQRVRNRLFTAITRSKAWVRVLGVGPQMQKLKDEFERVKAHDYKLDFIYPDAPTRKKLKIVNRDLSPEEQRRIKGTKALVDNLNNQLELGGDIFENLPKQDLEKLHALLTQKMGQNDS